MFVKTRIAALYYRCPYRIWVALSDDAWLAGIIKDDTYLQLVPKGDKIILSKYDAVKETFDEVKRKFDPSLKEL
jgi:hypothetical protein